MQNTNTQPFQGSYGNLAEYYAAEMLKDQRQKAGIASPIPANAVHAQGPGGVFGGGMEPNVYNAMILPQSGIMNAIPLRPSTRGTIAYSIISGVTSTVNSDGSGGTIEEREGPCDDPPMAGLTKMCTFSAPWGLWARQSSVIDIASLGEDEYCDTPLDLLGGFTGNNLAPMGWANMSNQVLRNTPAKALMELGVSFVRDFGPKFFTGNPANNTAGGGYKEFNGFERIINTGYTDMVSSTLCPASDSLVYDLEDDFNLAAPDDDPQLFIEIVRDLYNTVQHIAEQASLAQLNGAFVGPRWMFDGLARLWACGYLTDRCGATTQNVFSTSTDWIQFRDSMLQNRYLLIDGTAIPFIIDDSQPYTLNVDGSYTGTLYYIPLTVLGGIPVTYQQFKPFNGKEIQDAIRDFVPGNFFDAAPSPNGAFLIVRKVPVNTCVQVLGITKRRLVCHTPYLGFRLDNITLTRNVPYRNGYPGHAHYRNGGRSTAV